MADVIARLSAAGLVPVVEIGSAERAVPLGRALLAAGLACVEVAFRTSAAPDAIGALRERCPELLVGAGTVLTTSQADAARAAGAEFLVAPGLNPDVVEHAAAIGLPMIPGVCTPSEIERAMASGVDVLKFFPAEVAGGIGFLKAVAPVYPGVRFVPTGGIGPANVGSYLALANVAACGGSWMVKKELISAGDFAAIERLTAEAVALVAEARNASARGR